jgi:phytoene dehydrogenase-like protein
MKIHRAGTIVVGGGLAGLTAALSLARRGISVTLFEKSPALGGRARTRAQDGFHFNVGPHALYRGGVGMAVLRELGVRVKGQAPPLSGGYAFDRGYLHTLPVGLASLLTTGLLDLWGKAEMSRFFARLRRLDFGGDDTSLGEWLEAFGLRPASRRVVEAFVRLSTYAVDVAGLSAAAALRQLALAQRGVLYLDGGWQSLVDALAAQAREAGVRIVSEAPVAAVERQREIRGVSLSDGTREAADAVIVASGPGDVAALLDRSETTSVARWARTTAPVLMASLDVALASLPRPRALFAIGIDRPLYFSVHSATARLAPTGGALLHAAMYLGSGPVPDAAQVRQELESFVDRLQPGWRKVALHTRFLPHLCVTHGLPTAASGGLNGRPGPTVPDVPGLFVAGDWVGPSGLLADASIASGQQAADAVATRLKSAITAA